MPKIVDHDAQRARLAEAACRTIARHGLEGASMRSVAREAGCSTGPLVHYFGDKDRLLLHALRHAAAKTGGRMLRCLRSRRGFEALRALLEQGLPLDAERRGEWRIWLSFWGRAAGDPALAREQARRYADWRALMRAALERCQVEGEIASGLDLETEAEDLMALIDGIGIQGMFEPKRFTPRRQRAAVDRHLRRLAG